MKYVLIILGYVLIGSICTFVYQVTDRLDTSRYTPWDNRISFSFMIFLFWPIALPLIGLAFAFAGCDNLAKKLADKIKERRKAKK